MTPTQLFVYGTLRHDQPEHAKYCRGVTNWQPARLPGRLVRIAAGYRLVVVPPQAVLACATPDAIADEHGRNTLPEETIARAASATAAAGCPWIAGELLTFRDAVEAWPPIDAWEDFTPGKPGTYPRVVLPVEVREGGAWRGLAAWAYAATAVPDGSLEPGEL